MWLLMLACTRAPSDEAIALEICGSVPGVTLDAAGQAHLQDWVDPAELALWAEDEEYGLGIRTLGLGGYGTLRANTECAVRVVNPDAIQLTRAMPDWQAIEPFEAAVVWEQELITTDVVVELVDTPVGRRAHLGLAEARETVAEAQRMADEGRFDEALSALTSLEERFPDPMLHFERQEVERKRGLHERDRTLSGPDGQPMLLSELAGPVTLVVFWDSACEDCGLALETLADVAATRPELKILTLVPPDDPATEAPAGLVLRHDPGGWFDPDGSPYLVLLDRNLSVAWRWTGFDEGDEATLLTALGHAIRFAME